jgi:hypothetical protein
MHVIPGMPLTISDGRHAHLPAGPTSQPVRLAKVSHIIFGAVYGRFFDFLAFVGPVVQAPL